MPSPDSRDDLTSSEVCSYSNDESKHCQTCVEDLCLRGKTEFHVKFSCVLLMMMTRLPSWVNCNSSSGSHSSSSYKSSSFWISSQRASGLGILCGSIDFVYSAVTIRFVVFVSNHTSLCVLKCWHKHNEEENSWCANKHNGNNYIVSKEFNQVRHDVLSVQG